MKPVHIHVHRGAVQLEGRPSCEGEPIVARRMTPLSRMSKEPVNTLGRPSGTRDAGQFDESKHKRDGGKFSSTEGAGKSESNAAHSAKATPHAAEVRKSAAGTEKHEAHNAALSAWADARKHLDPDKPMAEQSQAYKDAVKKAEEASAKANELRSGAKKPAPGDKPEPKGTEKPASKPQGKRKPAAGAEAAKTAREVLRDLRRARNAADPDKHEHET